MKNFQEELRDTLLYRCDPKLSKKETLVDIFKTYVAKMLEQNVLANKNRLSVDYLTMVEGYLINEFRSAELGEWQMSEQQYADLFAKTMQEIFNDASLAHKGENVIQNADQRLEVNKKIYDNEVAPYIIKP
jgi:hypothetical protein